MQPASWLFDGWQAPARTVLVGVLAYVALVAGLRSSGKRTLSKMNAFDLVVTVALGSTLASALVTQSVTLAQAVAAFGLLMLLQYIVARSSVRWGLVDRAVKSTPTLLAHRGRLLEDNLRRERVSHDEVAAAVRRRGYAALDRVEAVVIESDGTLSVVERTNDGGDAPVLEGVRGFDRVRG